MHFRDEMPEHRFGDFEVRDDAIFQRPHRDDIRRRATEHPFRFVPDGENFVRACLHRHDRRFTQNYALVFDVNECVRRAEVDADVAG